MVTRGTQYIEEQILTEVEYFEHKIRKHIGLDMLAFYIPTSITSKTHPLKNRAVPK